MRQKVRRSISGPFCFKKKTNKEMMPTTNTSPAPKTEFNIYCDESCHLLRDGIDVMVLGAVWCPSAKRKEVMTRLKEIKVRHNLGLNFELKWNKVSAGKFGYYEEVINYFFDNTDLHFRCVVIPQKSRLDHHQFNQTHDDFYYKMNFELIKVILQPSSSYRVFLDIKDTRSIEKVNTLTNVLRNVQYDFHREIIRNVQQVRSEEVSIMQLTDLLTGAVAYLHRGLSTSSSKLRLLKLMRDRSGYSLKFSTLIREEKFNVFVWRSKN